MAKDLRIEKTGKTRSVGGICHKLSRRQVIALRKAWLDSAASAPSIAHAGLLRTSLPNGVLGLGDGFPNIVNGSILHLASIGKASAEQRITQRHVQRVQVRRQLRDGQSGECHQNQFLRGTHGSGVVAR